MKTEWSRSLLAKIASDEAAFNRFVQEIGVGFIRTLILGLIVGFILGAIVAWLVMA